MPLVGVWACYIATVILLVKEIAYVNAVVPTEPVPEQLKTQIQTSYRVLMTGGPTNVYPEVQKALAWPSMNMLTIDIIEDIKAGIRYIFQTKNKLTLAITGSGHAGIEAILQNLLEPGDKILIPVYGLWGNRVADMAKRIGAIVKTIEKPLGSTCTLEEFEEAVKLHKPNLVHIVHGESSTGVILNLTGLGDLCRKYDCLLSVDTVATILTEPVLVDEWKIDAAFCNTQKGLGSLAGFAPITFGPRAVAKMKSRKVPVQSFLHDVFGLNEYYWGIDRNSTRPKIYHHTIEILQLYALRTALGVVAKDTLEKVRSRHLAASKRFNKGLQELEFDHYVPEAKNRLLNTITLKVPKCVHHVLELVNYSRRDAIEFGSGLGLTLGKILRIGIIGPNANARQIDDALCSLNKTLEHFKSMKRRL